MCSIGDSPTRRARWLKQKGNWPRRPPCHPEPLHTYSAHVEHRGVKGTIMASSFCRAPSGRRGGNCNMRKAHASEHESEVATRVLPRENERGHSLLNL